MPLIHISSVFWFNRESNFRQVALYFSLSFLGLMLMTVVKRVNTINSEFIGGKKLNQDTLVQLQEGYMSLAAVYGK